MRNVFRTRSVAPFGALPTIRPWDAFEAACRSGHADEAPAQVERVEYVAESPSGETIRPTAADDGYLIELEEQGFYGIALVLGTIVLCGAVT